MRSGFFIALEGPDGAGKSTLSRDIADRLKSVGHDVLLTREPGGAPISEKIRSLILDPDNKAMCNATELLLFAAARAQHMQETIIPALESGKVVICDRFSLSTLSYQGHGRGLDLNLISSLNDIAVRDQGPDLVLVIDVNHAVSADRMRAMNKGLDRIEQEGGDFFNRVRRGFLIEASKLKNSRIIDGSHSIDEVSDDAMSLIFSMLETREA